MVTQREKPERRKTESRINMERGMKNAAALLKCGLNSNIFVLFTNSLYQATDIQRFM
jgi:hypothetical protein